MSPLAAITKDFSDSAGIQAAIRQTCLNFRRQQPDKQKAQQVEKPQHLPQENRYDRI